MGDKCEKKPKTKEKNVNAAWADIEKKTDEANVPIPGEDHVEIAKDWVEENKK